MIRAYTITRGRINQYKNPTFKEIAELENLIVESDTPARVVVDERTGTIVIGQDVRISKVAISHGTLTVRISEMPKVDAILMPSGGFWGGVGEPTICVAAPAVMNAYFKATGKRIRAFPLKNHNLQIA